jgi:hypothetical protein
MPASLSSDDVFLQISAAIAHLYPGLGCRRSRGELKYLHPTEPSTLSVAQDNDGRFQIFLEYTGPFAVVVSARARNLARLLDVVRDWREGH